jgi:hypothetical protein
LIEPRHNAHAAVDFVLRRVETAEPLSVLGAESISDADRPVDLI